MKINLERIVRVDGVEGNQICELLKLVSPFQYTSEYLFIVFESLSLFVQKGSGKCRLC